MATEEAVEGQKALVAPQETEVNAVVLEDVVVE
jgi:hypothetical protein